MVSKDAEETKEAVAPLAGAWIEIIFVVHNITIFVVAPLAGARIEIINRYKKTHNLFCRSPRGSVD